MLFSGITFLYFFLPAALIAYFAAPKAAKNYVLLAASLIFYFFGEPVYVLLLIFSSVSDYLHSLYIEKHRGTGRAKAALVSSIVINLAMLGFFKYADFFIATVNGVFKTAIPLVNVPLPIGISFFTFQTMSYTIDVYRGRVRAERNIFTLATFVCLFPQLVAGPIVRYSDVAGELDGRTHSLEDAARGAQRFVIGLAKKVLIANQLGEFIVAFRASADKSVVFYWAYAVAFALQIYFDFSGYSDMAIGLGRIFGFTFPENFNYPFTARSITDFWRRWHMSLSSWFRDYVYIPLGGNRKGIGRQLFNICVVWLLTGLWHGASWNFVLWGAFFAALLMLEKLINRRNAGIPGRTLPHICTMLLVIISFVIFNGDGVSGALGDLKGMFGGAGLALFSPETGYQLRNYAVLFILGAVGCTPLLKRLVERVRSHRAGERALCVLAPVGLAALLVLSTACIVDGSFNPFLYFRF